MSLLDLEKQFDFPKIKDDSEKPTIYIEYKNIPKEDKWKKLFIFEEEINLLATIIQQIPALKQENRLTTFKTDSKTWSDLISPWKIKVNHFTDLNKLSLLSCKV